MHSAPRKRIALVRGHHLSKEETVTYEPLREQYDFVCVSTDDPWYDHSEIAFPILRTGSVERWAGLPNRRLARRWFGFVDKRLGTGQWMPGLAGALRGADLVYTSDYCHLFSYQAARLKHRLGYKLVVMQYENIPFAREDRPWIAPLKRAIRREADLFLAMSGRAREALLLEGVPASRIRVIGNGVDTRLFSPEQPERQAWRSKFGVAPDEALVLFIGRLHETKGVFELVHAAWRLFQDPAIDRSRVRVMLVGRGRAEGRLRKRIAALGLGDRVQIVRGVPHKEIHFMHSMADIFTLPSVPAPDWQEQFGIVLIESMASGKPIVTTLTGSIPEVVDDAALLVQPADHFSLYQALRTLILDPDRRQALGRSARRRAEEQFALDIVAAKLHDAFQELLG